MSRPLIVAIHGIMTRQTTTSWPDRFAAFVDSQGDFMVEKKEYEAGPIPMLNVWWLNKRLARSLVASILPLLPRRVSFVAHSNGCDVALKAIKLLAESGHPVRAFVATGAAIEADVLKSGIADLLSTGKLGKAVAYCSRNDFAVKPPIIWPYGHLGCTGWRIGSAAADCEPRLVTRWFPGYGHSTYFDQRHCPSTFHGLLADAA